MIRLPPRSTRVRSSAASDVYKRQACYGRDRVQPDPRGGDHRVGVPRQSHHRDHPPAVDRGPGPPLQIRAATGRPPAQGLALAGQLGRTVQHGLRATSPSNNLTTAPQQAQPKTPVEKPDRPAAPPRLLAYTSSKPFSTTREYFRGRSIVRGCRPARLR